MAFTDLDTDFAGRRGRVFWLAMRTGMLTVLTLGIYRFWMKTRLRRFYWSSVRPGGQPLEYVGEPLEKLLGFLIAVVFLAFYIGIVNLVLMFASFSIFQDNTIAYAVSFIGVVPLWFYALYRARRYVLGRTRWRGVRFALDPGAWGYAWRAILHWGVTLLTLGILWPRMTFWLEKYKTDRTWFGTERLIQGGRWTMLIPAAMHVLVPLALSGVAAVAAWMYTEPWVLAGLFLTVPWALYGLIHYRVESLRLLTNTKTAGPIGFVARPRPRRVFFILMGGYTLVFLCMGLITSALGLVVVVTVPDDVLNTVIEGGSDLNMAPTIVVAASSYFLVFVAWAALRHSFVTLPIWRHYAETLRITGAHGLAQIAQRDRDPHREAEGFAEALDLGAAI